MRSITLLGLLAMALLGCTITPIQDPNPNPPPIASDAVIQATAKKCDEYNLNDYQEYRCLLWQAVAVCRPELKKKAATNVRLDADARKWHSGKAALSGQIEAETAVTDTVYELLGCKETTNRDKIALCDKALLRRDACLDNRMKGVEAKYFPNQPPSTRITNPEKTEIGPTDIEEAKAHIRYVLQPGGIRRPEFFAARNTGASCSESLIHAQKNEGGRDAAVRSIDGIKGTHDLFLDPP